MSRTEGLTPTITMQGPYAFSLTTSAAGEMTSADVIDPLEASRVAARMELSKLEQIVEYLKALYR